MQFDSNVYLAYSLGKSLSDFNSKEIGTVISLLEGFAIKPGSIRYDKDQDAIAVNFLPSENEDDASIDQLYISKDRKVFIKMSVNNSIKINILYPLYGMNPSYSFFYKDPIEKFAGVYYYESSKLNTSDLKHYQQSSYYDYATVATLQEDYLDGDKDKLEELISYDSTQISRLGFSEPDILKWGSESKSCNAVLDEQRYSAFNQQLRAINYNKVVEFMKSFQEEYQSVNKPITKGKFLPNIK